MVTAVISTLNKNPRIISQSSDLTPHLCLINILRMMNVFELEGTTCRAKRVLLQLKLTAISLEIQAYRILLSALAGYVT